MEYKIKIETDGQEFTCSEDETVLEAALRENVQLTYGCQSGACSSCMGQVVEGEFAYLNGRPQGITEQYADLGFALFCSAYPRSDMTIKTSF